LGADDDIVRITLSGPPIRPRARVFRISPKGKTEPMRVFEVTLRMSVFNLQYPASSSIDVQGQQHLELSVLRAKTNGSRGADVLATIEVPADIFTLR
jgi:hypothetical protein